MTDYQVFPIYARYSYPDNGYSGDRAQAAQYLTVGKDYLIDQMIVGRSSTTLYLHQFPGIGFNQVMFSAGSNEYEEMPEEGTADAVPGV